MTIAETGSGQEWTAFEHDALKETMSIGAGHAATALSQLAKTNVLIAVPQVNLVPLAEVPKLLGPQEQPMVGLFLRLSGQGAGGILLAFPRECASQLVNIMLGGSAGRSTVLSDMEQSALREAGNILAGAFLTALGNFLGVVFLPSVPHLAVDMAGALIQALVWESGTEGKATFVVHLTFREQIRGGLWGHLLVAPDAETLQSLRTALRRLGAGGD